MQQPVEDDSLGTAAPQMSALCAKSLRGGCDMDLMTELLGEEPSVLEAQSTSFRQMRLVLNRYERCVRELFRPVGITALEHLVLTRLRDYSSTRLARLAERCDTSRQLMHQTVRRLAHQRLVELEVDEHHRELRVLLTERGRGVLDAADEALRHLRSNIVARFGVQQQAALRALLTDLERALGLWRNRPDLFDD